MVQGKLTFHRLFTALSHGFISGIPLALVGATLQAWMKTENVDLKTIGAFGLVGLAYSFKVLWAPLLDRYDMPLLTRWFGRRRSWMLVFQILIAIGLFAMAAIDPVHNASVMALCAALVAFASASLDIVIDAYRNEVYERHEYGLALSATTIGYRVAMLITGAGALVLSDHTTWSNVYLLMGLLAALAMVFTVVSVRESNVIAKPKTIKEAVVQPFFDFFSRRGAVEALIFLFLYKLDTFLTVALTTPFMMELGFSRTEIAAVMKGYGMIATIVGVTFGGTLMVRLGIKRSLVAFGVIQALAALSYYALAVVGNSYALMVVAITIENLFSGMGIAAQSAFMMSICNKKFSATQYALLSGLMAASRSFAQPVAGYMVTQVGWAHFYLFCVFVGVPALVMLIRFDKWQVQVSN